MSAGDAALVTERIRRAEIRICSAIIESESVKDSEKAGKWASHKSDKR